MERTKWNIGPHVLEFKEPDVVHAHTNAVIDVAEVKEVFRVISEEVFPHVGRVFYILQLGPDSKGLTPAARKYAGTQPLDKFKAMLIVGGPPLARAALSIVVRAVALLGLAQKTPQKIFSTEEEAFAFIKEIRDAEQAKSAQS